MQIYYTQHRNDKGKTSMDSAETKNKDKSIGL